MPAHQLSIKIGYHHLEGRDQTYLPRKTVRVKTIKIHHGYKGNWHEVSIVPNDIAILELEEELDLNTYTPACLARKIHENRFGGVTATVAGWGLLDQRRKGRWTETEVPHEVEVPVMSSSECARQFPGTFNHQMKHPSHLCAGRRNYGKSAFKVSYYLIQGVCRQSAKAKLKNRHFTGGYRAQNLFSSLYKLGSNFLWIREV